MSYLIKLLQENFDLNNKKYSVSVEHDINLP